MHLARHSFSIKGLTALAPNAPRIVAAGSSQPSLRSQASTVVADDRQEPEAYWARLGCATIDDIRASPWLTDGPLTRPSPPPQRRLPPLQQTGVMSQDKRPPDEEAEELRDLSTRFGAPRHLA